MDPFSKEAYDECYLTSEKYKQHYQDLIYFVVWDYVRTKLHTTDKLLDLGCGPGHLAHLLHDFKFEHYIGIDFSKVGIQLAKHKVPRFTFIEADLRNLDYSNYSNYKFISIETLEHLENDIALIKKLPKNSIIFSVPNYMCIDHYRTYDSEDLIKDYYKEILNIIKITSFPVGKESIIYVVEANIK